MTKSEIIKKLELIADDAGTITEAKPLAVILYAIIGTCAMNKEMEMLTFLKPFTDEQMQILANWQTIQK